MKVNIKASMTLNGKINPDGYRMIAALIKGAINGVPSAHLEFVARNKSLDLGKLVGTDMGFWVEDEYDKRQYFWGTCISAEAKGAAASEGVYVAEIRPWLWFLSRSKNNRIFQEMKTTDIIKDILGDYGFSGDLKMSHSSTEETRTYCVQYAETDLNFIKRLLEEEGFYFYFEYEENKAKMVLTDQPATHGSAGGKEKYYFSNEESGSARDQISSWTSVEKAVTGKVTLRDYDFTKPSAQLTSSAEIPSGTHAHKAYESYAYPGGFSDVSHGDKRATALIEEQATGHQVWSATGNMLNLNVGKIFEIVDHPNHESASETGFMVSDLTQFLSVGEGTITGNATIRNEPDLWGGPTARLDDHASTGETQQKGGASDSESTQPYFQTRFSAVRKSIPYRGPALTKRPRMVGVQTAVVTGPQGEEIHVDKYGRIKVQFHWDRDGKKDEKTTCWVRTMMPWTGKNWGMIALPRIGQEVVIQFEEGDPDRPICVGMLYNADTMPPYELPANATRTGTKTNTSKGGGGYNELMFEDKTGEELVRFMAQKDYVQNTQNSAHVKVGYAHPQDVKSADTQDAGSMTLDVFKHLDETVETGDHSFSVLDGKQTVTIEKDQVVLVNKNSDLTVTDNYDTTVTEGNMSTSVSSGNMTTSVTSGNISVSASAGKIDMQAAQSITLTCGGSSIKLSPDKVEIKGMMITVDASMKLTAKGGITGEFNGGAMTIVKGGMVMVN